MLRPSRVINMETMPDELDLERLYEEHAQALFAFLWREEILRAARAAARTTTAPRASERSWLIVLESRLAALLWPHPGAWAGLAALWLLILGLGLAARDSAPHQPRQAASPSPQMRELLRQQEQLLAELMGPLDQSVADRRRTAPPQPHSQRTEENSYA